MQIKKPFIGITPGYDADKDISFIKSGYYEGVLKAGGLPVLIPLNINEDILNDYFNRCDGFLLSGGSDIDAMLYGENNLPANGEISPLRDLMEVFIVKKAIELNKPILGICRGIQVMNVAQGGTLYQDMGTQIKDREVIKHDQSAPKWYPTHNVKIENGSIVRSLLGKDQIRVNSFHHQAVKDVAKDFWVTSSSEDGIIESIEHKNHIFALGVQWHPELMWKENDEFLKFFKELVVKSQE
jgi:putative glutamine amidotransferase